MLESINTVNKLKITKEINSLFIMAILVVFIAFSPKSLSQTLNSQCVTSISCESEAKPKWEIGIAGFGINAPDYPSSDENKTRTLIVPYFIYRGDIIRAGEGGLIKAKAFEDERWELDLSIDGAFNADSDNNEAREGMEDLDYLFGIGPELTYQIHQEEINKKKLELKFQLRAMFSTDFSHFNQRGYAFETQLRYEHLHLFQDDIKFIASIGPIWGTEKLMDYFFEINSQDVRLNREEFNAKSGYIGTELNLTFVMPVLDKRARIFLGIRSNLHQKSTNESSPLFKQDNTLSVALGFTYQLFKSERKSKY